MASPRKPTRQRTTQMTTTLIVASAPRMDDLDLDQVSELTGLHRGMIQELARARLVRVSANTPPDAPEPRFDEHGLLRLRQIAILRQQHRANLRTVRMIVRLMDRLEDAESQLRFLRDQFRVP